MCDKHNPRSPGNGADWYCTCTYVADHNGPHRCTCGFQWPTPPIEPEAEPLTDREPTVNEVAMLATIDRLTRERDGAILTIGYMAWCENCAPGYNAIATAALDGEG